MACKEDVTAYYSDSSDDTRKTDPDGYLDEDVTFGDYEPQIDEPKIENCRLKDTEDSRQDDTIEMIDGKGATESTGHQKEQGDYKTDKQTTTNRDKSHEN